MCSDISHIYNLYRKSDGVSINSRTISSNQLFFAIKGNNFDGNRYAQEAINKGALAVIVDDPKLENTEKHIHVKNSLVALQQLATMHRLQLDATVFIAIGGSNGKTTTKSLLHAVFSQHYNTFATEGNLNNHIGVPLSILSVNHDYDIAICENWGEPFN